MIKKQRNQGTEDKNMLKINFKIFHLEEKLHSNNTSCSDFKEILLLCL